MRLTNHIAFRFLKDESLLWEIMEIYFPQLKMPEFNTVSTEEMASTFDVLRVDNNKSYYVTETVIDKLDLLKVDPVDNKYDWTVFQNIKEGKSTFILPDNSLVRVSVRGHQICFACVSFKFTDKKSGEGYMHTCLFHLDRNTNEVCSHYYHKDVQQAHTMIYKLMCFIHLSDTEEIVVLPGRKYGTKITGKIVNELGVKLTIINSRWNITAIRNEGFSVSGHFRLQPCGEGRKERRIKWIDPFDKHGYVRTAKKETENV